MEDFDFNDENETIEEVQQKNKEFIENLLKQYEGKDIKFKKYEEYEYDDSDDDTQYNYETDSGNEDIDP